MYEVCVVWGDELIVHRTDCLADAIDWAMQYRRVRAVARVWFAGIQVAFPVRGVGKWMS